MSGLFNTITGSTLFEHNSVTGGANDVEVNNLLVDGDCTILGTLTANIDANAAGTTTGAVQVRSSTGTFDANDNFIFNPTTNVLQLASAVTATFNGYCRFLGSTMDISDALTTNALLNIYSIPLFRNGLYRPVFPTSSQFPNGGTITTTMPIPKWATEICIHIRNLNTTAGTTPPFFQFHQYGAATDVSGLLGSCQHSNGQTRLWTGQNAYLWAETWSSALAVSGIVVLKRANGLNEATEKPWFTIISNLSSAPTGSSITTCAGSWVLNSYNPALPNLEFGIEIRVTSTTFSSGGYYNITYA